MRKTRRPTLVRFTAFALITALVLPSPAWALRAEARPEAKSGLEELEQVLRGLSASLGISVFKTGLEELGRPDTETSHTALLLGGVGNIGRGFIAPLLGRNNFDIFFVDFNQPLIAAANERDSYVVTPVGGGDPVTVEHFWGIDARDQDRVAAQGPRADWIFTTVGTENIIKLREVIYHFIRNRIAAGHRATLNIVFAENLPIDQPQIAALRQAVLDQSDAEMAQYILESVNFIGAPPVGSFREYELTHVGWPGAVVGITVPPTLVKAETDNPLDISVEGGGPYELVVDGKELKNTPFVPSGIKLVENIRAAREKKLLIHNMGHAAFAYLAWSQGVAPEGNPAGAIQPGSPIERIVRRAMEESAAGLLHRYATEFTKDEMNDYIEQLLQRFANVDLNDTVERIARDPLRKLATNDRLVGAAISAKEAEVEPEAILLSIAAALRYAETQGVTTSDLQAVKQRIQELGFKLPETEVEFQSAFDHLSAAGLEEDLNQLSVRLAEQWQKIWPDLMLRNNTGSIRGGVKAGKTLPIWQGIEILKQDPSLALTVQRIKSPGGALYLNPEGGVVWESAGKPTVLDVNEYSIVKIPKGRLADPKAIAQWQASLHYHLTNARLAKEGTILLSGTALDFATAQKIMERYNPRHIILVDPNGKQSFLIDMLNPAKTRFLSTLALALQREFGKRFNDKTPRQFTYDIQLYAGGTDIPFRNNEGGVTREVTIQLHPSERYARVLMHPKTDAGLEEKNLEDLLRELKEIPAGHSDRVGAMREIVGHSPHLTSIAAFAVAAGRPEWTDAELADLFIVLADLFDAERQTALLVREMVQRMGDRQPVTPLPPLPDQRAVLRSIESMRELLAPEPLPGPIVQAASQKSLPQFSNLLLVGAWMLSQLAEVASVREPVQDYFRTFQKSSAEFLLYWRLNHFETRVWHADLLGGFSIEGQEDRVHFFEILDATEETLPEGPDWGLDLFKGLVRRYRSEDGKITVATDGVQIGVEVKAGSKTLGIVEHFVPDLISTVLEIQLDNKRIWQWQRPRDERRRNPILVGLSYDPVASQLKLSLNRQQIPLEQVDVLRDRIARLLGTQEQVSVEWASANPPAWTQRESDEDMGDSAGLEEPTWMAAARSRIQIARNEVPNEEAVQLLVYSLIEAGPYGRQNRQAAMVTILEWLRQYPERAISLLAPRAYQITDALLDVSKNHESNVSLPYRALGLLEDLSQYPPFREALIMQAGRLDRAWNTLFRGLSNPYRLNFEATNPKNLPAIRELPRLSWRRFHDSLQEAAARFQHRVLVGVGPSEAKQREGLLRVLGRIMPSDVKSRIFVVTENATFAKELSELGFVAGSEPALVLLELNEEFFPESAEIRLDYHALPEEEKALREAAALWELDQRFKIVRQQADPNPFAFLQAILANLMGVGFDSVPDYVNARQLNDDLLYLLNA